MGLQPTLTREEYLEKIKMLQEHIQLGDIYEVNFCQEFVAENAEIEPTEMYAVLNKKTRAPFSVFQKNNEHFLFSGSPERYLKKSGNKVISQPIKGTARRSQHQAEDLEIKTVLENSVKERAENVMIVDLVRNDLSITAADNTVEVEELFFFPMGVIKEVFTDRLHFVCVFVQDSPSCNNHLLFLS